VDGVVEAHLRVQLQLTWMNILVAISHQSITVPYICDEGNWTIYPGPEGLFTEKFDLEQS
jgi:hypothetical protein